MNDSLRDILVSDLPPSFVRRLIDAARWTYLEAHAQMEGHSLYGEPECEYLEPHVRRALFEAKLAEIALDSGLKVTTERVASGAAQYRLVRAGRLQLTGSKTTSRNVVPRRCVFRRQYADINEHINQQQLFPVPSDPDVASLYCMIIHGASVERPGELGYCCFAFPTQQGDRWAQEPIDLEDIRDYQATRYSKVPDERAQIQVVEPKLKPGLGNDAESEGRA